MTEISALLIAHFVDREKSAAFEDAINALSDVCWDRIRTQLPRKGLMLVDEIDTGARDLLRSQLPRFQALCKGVVVTESDLSLLLNAGARSSEDELKVHFSGDFEDLTEAKRLAELFKAAGASYVEGCIAGPGKSGVVRW